MKKYLFAIIIFIICINICSSDVPLIFLHGQKSKPAPWYEEDGVNKGGWNSWNPQNMDLSREHSSSMTDILDIQYGGYIAGTPLNCDKFSILTSTSGNTKVIYNFSFYIDTNTAGVIGSNGRFYPVENSGPFYLRDSYIQFSEQYSWANNLAEFIDKVLQTTGASQVDIITHSMGGVVARAAIAYYGCENKVRKLMTIGTPNHSFKENEFIEAIIINGMLPMWWQKRGELLELGANYLT